jgi:hypothetical protein
VVALAGVAPLAHGGLYGAIAEGALALAVCAFLAWVWLRERRRQRGAEHAPAEMNDL